MMYLNDFLAAKDFSAMVESTGAVLQERFGLPEVYQLGLIVPDIEAADETMVSLGLPPSFIASVKTDRWMEKGEDMNISAKLGFAYHQGHELELIEPGDNASFYAQDLDPQGEIVVHHFGFMIKNLEDWMARLASQGVPLLVRGKLSMGIVTGEFAYFDTRKECGMITELISMKILGVHRKLPSALLERLARLQVKTGKRTISV